MSECEGGNELGVGVRVNEVTNANESVAIVIPHTEHVADNLRIRRSERRNVLVVNRDSRKDVSELNESPRLHPSVTREIEALLLLLACNDHCSTIEFVKAGMLQTSRKTIHCPQLVEREGLVERVFIDNRLDGDRFVDTRSILIERCFLILSALMLILLVTHPTSQNCYFSLLPRRCLTVSVEVLLHSPVRSIYRVTRLTVEYTTRGRITRPIPYGLACGLSFTELQSTHGLQANSFEQTHAFQRLLNRPLKRLQVVQQQRLDRHVVLLFHLLQLRHVLQLRLVEGDRHALATHATRSSRSVQEGLTVLRFISSPLSPTIFSPFFGMSKFTTNVTSRMSMPRDSKSVQISTLIFPSLNSFRIRTRSFFSMSPPRITPTS